MLDRNHLNRLEVKNTAILLLFYSAHFGAKTDDTNTSKLVGRQNITCHSRTAALKWLTAKQQQ